MFVWEGGIPTTLCFNTLPTWIKLLKSSFSSWSWFKIFRERDEYEKVKKYFVVYNKGIFLFETITETCKLKDFIFEVTLMVPTITDLIHIFLDL